MKRSKIIFPFNLNMYDDTYKLSGGNRWMWYDIKYYL